MMLVFLFIGVSVSDLFPVVMCAPGVLFVLLLVFVYALSTDSPKEHSIREGNVSLDSLLWCATAFSYIICLSYAYALTSPNRPRPSRVQSDLRTYSVAVNSYHLDNGQYPNWSLDPAKNNFAWVKDRTGILKTQPTFLLKVDAGPGNLTTPVAYMSTLPHDLFSPIEGAMFCYWTPLADDKTSASFGGAASTPKGYIMWSAGPDRQYDLTIQNIALAFDEKSTTPTAFLIAHTYDPTNGVKSRGDIWRIGPR